MFAQLWIKNLHTWQVNNIDTLTPKSWRFGSDDFPFKTRENLWFLSPFIFSSVYHEAVQYAFP